MFENESETFRLIFTRENLSHHLEHYSKLYPRYIPIDLATYEHNAIDQVFYLMPVIIGIPQALLNLVVLISVILITRLHQKTHGNCGDREQVQLRRSQSKQPPPQPPRSPRSPVNKDFSGNFDRDMDSRTERLRHVSSGCPRQASVPR